MQTDSIPLLRKRQNNKDSTEENPFNSCRDNMEARAEHETRKKFNFVYSVSAALGVILAIVLITWLIHCRDGFGTEDPNKIFNWHPLLMIFGMFIIGFTGFLFPGYPGAIRAAILPIHTAFGIGIFFFAIIAAITGIVEKIIFGLGDKYEGLPSKLFLRISWESY
ncbi:cytochrome b561-related [Holotrichia oblita]|uniref:Cytochrome b561-related n=1 Tax=Holotrichia oblita TaxID=644536 RepID=A0ACB9SHH7_HOLOL|nr:cytochrome b561-related [Holotrichia oblita]